VRWAVVENRQLYSLTLCRRDFRPGHRGLGFIPQPRLSHGQQYAQHAGCGPRMVAVAGSTPSDHPPHSRDSEAWFPINRRADLRSSRAPCNGLCNGNAAVFRALPVFGLNDGFVGSVAGFVKGTILQAREKKGETGGGGIPHEGILLHLTLGSALTRGCAGARGVGRRKTNPGGGGGVAEFSQPARPKPRLLAELVTKAG